MIADLSHYQGSIDWSKAAPHLDFVILRATVGSNKDNLYKEYAANCRAYKVPFGTYHYVKATTEEEARTEADHFYDTASTENPLFYVADIEYDPTLEAGYDKIGAVFLTRLKERGARKLGLYIAQRFYPRCELCQKLIDFNWIPRYGKDTGLFDPQYTPTCDYDLHQYTSKGYLEGTDGTVDLNRLSGTKSIEWFTEGKEENGMAYVMTAKEMIEKCLDVAKNYKTIYMYAAYGFQVTDATIASKKKQNLNGWYDSSTRVKKLKAVANQNPPTWGFDCVNLLKGILWGWVGDTTKEKGGAKYKANGVPDTNANGLFNRCLNKSEDFTTIVPGEAVWLEGHIGLYVGDNLVVECTTSFDNKVLISGLKNIAEVEGYPNRKWKKHGFLPYLDYEGLLPNQEAPVEVKYELGDRTLKKGMKGEDVVELQKGLINLGYNLGSSGHDGDFGPATEKAVKEFQKNNGLESDGIFGKASYEKFMEVTKDTDGEEVEQPEVEEPEVAPTPEEKKTYTVTGGKVYLWNGHPSYGGEKNVIVKKGDKLEVPNFGTYIPIIYNGDLKWINSKYID